LFSYLALTFNSPCLYVFSCEMTNCSVMKYIKHEKTVFDHISRHREESWKYDIFLTRCLEIWSNFVLSVWCISQSKLILRRKRRNKIVIADLHRFTLLCHLTSTTRIPFVFSLLCKFWISSGVWITIAPISIGNRKVKDSGSCSQMTPSCKSDIQTPSRSWYSFVSWIIIAVLFVT